MCYYITRNGDENMLSRTSKFIVNKLYDMNNIEDKNRREITAYGLEIILSTFLSITAVLIFAAVTERVKETIIFLVFFMPLRTYGGGYHADTHFRCFLILFACISFLYYLLYSIPINILMITAWIEVIYGSMVIEVFSPVVDSNHPMSKRQIKYSKKITRILICVYLILCVVLNYIQSITLLFTASYAIFITAMSMFAANIKQKIKGR